MRSAEVTASNRISAVRWHDGQVADVARPDPSPKSESRLVHHVVVPATALASCVLACVVFGVGASDDAYITYWEAEQLAKTGQLVNINGVHIEQSSSLAHVFVLAILYFVTRAPLPVLGYGVGLASLFATILLSARLAKLINPATEYVAAVVVGLAFPIVYWATGGLETDLAAVCVLWFVLRLHAILAAPELRTRTILGFLASAFLVVTVRPDTMIAAFLMTLLVVACSLLSVASRARRFAWLTPVSLSRSFVALGGTSAVILAVAAFRELVFGAVLPQPELAKNGGLSWLSTGLSYVVTSLPYWMWFAILALGALGIARCIRSRSLLGCLAGAAFASGVAVILFSRGDWMGGARLLVPYLAPALVVVAVGTWSLRVWWRRGALLVVVTMECVTLVLLANGTTWLSSFYTQLRPSSATAGAADIGSSLGSSWTSSIAPRPQLPWYSSWDYVSTRDGAFLAAATPHLNALVDEEPNGDRITLASNQAGMVFYTWANQFPGKIDYIDTESVVTHDFTRCQGLFDSYAGEYMTFAHWVSVAGKCAPSLPDLYLGLDQPSQTQLLLRYYHVISIVTVDYERRGIGTTQILSGTEFLAEKDGWSP